MELFARSSVGAWEPSSPEHGSVRSPRLARLLRSAELRRHLLRAGDAAAGVCAVVGALWSWSFIDGDPLTAQYVREHAEWFVMAGVWVLLLYPAYRSNAAFSTRDSATVLAHAVSAGVGLYLVLYFLAPRDLLPRVVVMNFLALAGVATLLWRVAHGRWFGEDAGNAPVAIVGAGRAARNVAALLRELAPQKTVKGLFASGNPSSAAEPEGSPATDLRRLIADRRVSELILAPGDEPLGPDMLRTVVSAQEHGASVVPMQAVYEQLTHRLPVRYAEPAWVLASLADARIRAETASGLRVAKRVVDVAGACIGCGVLLLLLPVLCPLVWLDVGRPLFFRQERLGLAGHPFRLLKFRTMGTDAELAGPRWADADDSRTSRIGRFLRRSHLDELPQFWNVLRGEMSLVGPRPERPEFVTELVRHIPCYRERLLVRPGMSGWAQVNYGYGSTVEDALEKLEYDLYYIRHSSLWLDAEIVGRTIWAVLGLGGR